jgi:hypothetical protein
MQATTLSKMLRLQEQHASAFRGHGRDTRDVVAMAALFDSRTRRMRELAERPSRMMRDSVVETASTSLHSHRRMLDYGLAPSRALQLSAVQAALEPTRRIEGMLRQAVGIAAEQALYERRMRPWSAAGLGAALDEASPVSAEELSTGPSAAETAEAVAGPEPTVGADPIGPGRRSDFCARLEQLSPSERRSLALNLVGIALALANVVILWGKAGGFPAALAAGQLMKAILDLANTISAMYEEDAADPK